MRSLLFLFFVGLFGAAQPGFAQCDFSTSAFRDELSDPSQIEHISVEIKKSRKWMKNSMSIITSGHENILNKYKRKFKATLIVQYPFGVCRLPAKVRQNGDWKDHIKLTREGNIVSSLDVKLEAGNILNSVRFKILLPGTRGGRREIFGALLLRELGFIAPETFLVAADVNGARVHYLFQENSEKEMLERNLRREGPIFEGDEALIWDYQDYEKFKLLWVSLSRLTNTKWAMKGETSTKIALKAFQRLQMAYLDQIAYHLDAPRPSKATYKSRLVPNPSNSNNVFENYAVILMALNGEHALTPHNRKFYFNSFSQSFEPIYYDGNIVLGPYKDSNLKSFTKEDGEFFYGNADRNFIKNAIDRLDQLKNDDEFINRYIKRSGLEEEQSEKFVKDALEITRQNLLSFEQDLRAAPEKSYRLTAEQARQLFFEQAERKKFQTSTLIMDAAQPGGLYSGTAATPSGEPHNLSLSLEELVEIIGKNTYQGERMVILPPDQSDESKAKDVSSIPFMEGDILMSDGARVKIDDKNKFLRMTQTTPTDWILVRSVTMAGWTVIFDGSDQEPSHATKQRFNEFGLTGCLNFYDVNLSDVVIRGSNGQCEDSVNIVSSRGELKELTVIDGFADAVDIDFSEIHIDKLVVNRTGNDCFDVSTGDFFLGSATLQNCGDKGISVGENSQFRADKVVVEKAVIGISSKDLSASSVKQFVGESIQVCAEAFQKKQEFGGSTLTIEAYECEGPINVDAHSDIAISGATQ